MDGRLRNMTSIYLFKGGKVLLLYRQGGRVVNNVWTGSAGGHFEKNDLICDTIILKSPSMIGKIKKRFL